MLEAVRTLGAAIRPNEGSSDLRDYLSLAKLMKTKYVLSIVIERGSYRRVSVDNYRPDVAEKYLYSAGSSNGPDRTPASLITDPEKTFKKKILTWFNKYGTKDNELHTIGMALQNNSKEIIADLKSEFNEFKKQERRNILLTIKTSDDEFIGEKEAVRKILLSQFNIGSGVTGTCLFCHKVKQLILNADKTFKSPVSDIFSFSTFDKRGFAYVFNESNIHKQIPVCSECYRHLKRGKDWLDSNAYFNFEGYKYYILPDVNEETGNELVMEFISCAKQHAERQQRKKDGALQYQGKYLMQEEESLAEYLADRGIGFSLLFIFVSLKGGGKYMDLIRLVEDVPTTWIKQIFDSFNYVLKSPVFEEEKLRRIVGQGWNGDFRQQKGVYLMALIKTFFPPNSVHIAFIDVVEKILQGSPLHSRDLLAAFLQKIRSEIHKSQYNSKILSLKSLILLLTLLRLRLITDWKESISSMSSTNLAEGYSEIFNSDAKWAVYLEGVLVGKLLAAQYARRKSTPFMDKLHGLHLGFLDAKCLLPKIINKLREYELSYKELEEKVATHFRSSEKLQESLTSCETSYYFVLGMLLHSSEEV